MTRWAGLAMTVLALLGAAPVPRTTVVAEWTCWNALDRRVVTLFGNGTVRLKRTGAAESALWLGELDGPRFDAFLRRLAEPDLSETEGSVSLAPEGEWIEQCDMALSLPNRKGWKFSYGRFDSLPLAVAQLVRVFDDLTLVADQMVGLLRLPEGYAPRAGDLLRRRDGTVFRVVGLSQDKKSVELGGTIVPLTVYLAIADLPREFDSLLERAPGLEP